MQPIEQGVIDRNNLPHVIEELIWSVQNDSVAKKLLDTDISYYTSANIETELHLLKLRLEVLERSLNPVRYLNAVMVKLSSAIFSAKKAETDILARSLLTTLINMGMSKQHLYNEVQRSFFLAGPRIENEDGLQKFYEAIEPKIHSFEVTLLGSKNINHVKDSMGAFRLHIPDLSDAVSKTAKEHNFLPAQEEMYITAKDIKAYDAFSARQQAIRNLDTLSDLLALFQHRSRIAWREEAIVIQGCCSEEIKWISPPKGAMHKASDLRPDKAAKELNSFIQTFSAKGISFSKFNRVADMHGICVNHNIPENQLVNIWTSLETLTPSTATRSKIANTTASALPFLLHSYIPKLVKQVTYDLLTWDKWVARRILNRIETQPKTPLWKKCFLLLCLPENQAIRESLYESLRDFHLLRYRIFKLSEALSDRRKIRELIALHEKKVAWQIRRIYRTRNLMIHSGRRAPSYIDTLVENGHDYLDTILIEVMKISCGYYGATTLEQIFEISKVRYDVFLSKLSETAPLDASNSKFLIGNE